MISGHWSVHDNSADGGSWIDDSSGGVLIKRRSVLASCLRGKTIFFAGSSFLRVMLLGFIEELTGQQEDPYIASRDPDMRNFPACKNLDGYDLQRCGWPQSKWWLIGPSSQNKYVVIDQLKHTMPPAIFPDRPNRENNQWLIVFQFKTFVLTPEVDAEIVRQAEGYKADLIVIDTGIWGYLPHLGSILDQTSSFFKTIQRGYSNNVIAIIDGYHQGMIGPHIVNGSLTRATLIETAARLGFIVFDRTNLLMDTASQQPETMTQHGYAGLVSDVHAQMLFSFMCSKH